MITPSDILWGLVIANLFFTLMIMRAIIRMELKIAQIMEFIQRRR